MSNLLPANRVAAIAAFCTGLSAAVLAELNDFPQNWQQTVIAAAGILGAIGTALHFMLGSQKVDTNTSNEKIASINLEAAQHYHQAALVQAGATGLPTTTNVTDVTGVTDGVGEDTEAPNDIDADTLAVPENLDPQQWLANRNIPVSDVEPATTDPTAAPATPVETTGETQSSGIAEPTTTGV